MTYACNVYLVVMGSIVAQAIVTARATGTGMTGTGVGIETEIVNWADLKGIVTGSVGSFRLKMTYNVSW